MRRHPRAGDKNRAAVVLFHAGTIKKGAKMVNVAGRVLSVCARSTTLVDALRKAYEAVPKVRFAGARYRSDIGWRALELRKTAGGA